MKIFITAAWVFTILVASLGVYAAMMFASSQRVKMPMINDFLLHPAILLGMLIGSAIFYVVALASRNPLIPMLFVSFLVLVQSVVVVAQAAIFWMLKT